jgi:hypothetical protein
MSAQTATLELTVSDVSRQKVRYIENVPSETTAAEIVQSYLDDLGIPRNEPTGRSLTYRALLPREGRHLRPNEKIGESLQSGDWLVLQPNIDAG